MTLTQSDSLDMFAYTKLDVLSVLDALSVVLLALVLARPSCILAIVDLALLCNALPWCKCLQGYAGYRFVYLPSFKSLTLTPYLPICRALTLSPLRPKLYDLAAKRPTVPTTSSTASTPTVGPHTRTCLRFQAVGVWGGPEVRAR